MFIDLTLSNGQPLDIPVFSILLAEELDEESSKANNGAITGLFFDLGSGLQNALVTQPFEELDKALAVRAPDLLRLRSAHDKPLLLAKTAVIGIRGIATEEMPGNTQLTCRFGQQAIPMNVMDTRDEIREKLDG